MNWWRLDPWFTIRLVFHAWHPNSPLSDPLLTHRAFFGDSFPLSAVIPFQRRMNRYESYQWPFSMMRPFASASSILQHVAIKEDHPRVLVMAGSQDKLMTPQVTRETTVFYRNAVAETETQSSANAEKAVHMEIVEGAGHHLQNDVQWEVGAEKVLEFQRAVAKLQ